MKKYEMTLNNTKKEVNVRIWGMYGPDDAKSFVEDFTKIVSTIQTSEFVLSFDAEELKVSAQEMLPMLEGCFKMYKDLGFKKVVAKVENNVTLKMQLKRLGRNAGLDIEIV
jgi:hypothetical protein